MRVTWHTQPEDKVEPVLTHANHVVRNCDGNPEKLRSGLLNIPEHSSYRHQLSPEKSRCRIDPKYEPSRIIVTDLKAYAMMLTNVTKGCTLFKHPQDFCLGKDSYTVESFNNEITVFQDKRISFSDGQYISQVSVGNLSLEQECGL